MSDFTQGKVRRGRITNYRTGNFVEFHHNPNRITKKKGTTLSVDQLPGQSDPLVRFASGNLETIDFVLDLCGESRLRRFGAQLFNGAVPEFPIEDADESYSVAGEIEFWESFQHPVDPAIAAARFAEPDQVVFTFGRMFQGVLCAVQDLEVEPFEFDPELSPTKAQVKVKLARIVTKQRFADSIWDVPAGIGIAPDNASRAPQFYTGKD